MKNCFVVKLNESVSNTDLPELGILKFSPRAITTPTPSQATQRLRIAMTAGNKTNAIVSGNGTIGLSYGSMTETQINDVNAAIFCSNGNYDVKFTNKYEISYIQMGSGISFNLSEMDYPNKVGTLSVVSNSQLYGDVKNLSKSVELTTVDVGLYSPAYGNIENMIEGQVANGRTSGTIVLNIGTSQIKLNNATFSSTVKYCTCVFENNEVKCYKGSTGTINDTLIKTYNTATRTWTIA